MYLGKLGEQIVLKSRKAFEQLSFQEAIYAEKEDLLSEEDEPRSGRKGGISFRTKQKESSRCDYMIDILREEWKNDDARLSRNLSE